MVVGSAIFSSAHVFMFNRVLHTCLPGYEWDYPLLFLKADIHVEQICVTETSSSVVIPQPLRQMQIGRVQWACKHGCIPCVSKKTIHF